MKMNVKKQKMILGTMTVLFLILALMAIQATALQTGPKIKVSLISQEPDPGSPGELMDVRFKVENIGDSVADNINFQFIEEYPFLVYNKEVQQNLGSLQGMQKDEEGIIVLYKLKIDENAVEGSYNTSIRYKIGNSDWITVKDFPIRVRTRDLVLSVESIESSPKSISPGENFELSLELRNNADSLIRDIKVKLGLSDPDIPIAPSDSIAEKQIYQISSDTGKFMKFNLVAMPDAKGGIYKIPINLSYTDETGVSYSKSDIISLKIASTPDLLVTIESSEIKAKVKSGKVSIKIVNRGLTNIKLLSAKLSETKDFEIVSQPEVYVGNIDSDDYETVDYTLNVKSYDSTITLPIELKYKDATNQEQNQKINLILKTYSQSRLASTLSGIFSGLVIIVIIVGIGLGIRWLLKRRKKKQ
jgi:hypothetical protein